MASNHRRGQAAAALADVRSVLATAAHAQAAQPAAKPAQQAAAAAAVTDMGLEQERAQLFAAHQKRMADLEEIRRSMQKRAEEVEHAAKVIEQERYSLKTEYAAKISEMASIKLTLEKQVNTGNRTI